MFFKLFFYVITFLILNLNLVYSLENKILFKVNNEIITSIDILNEISYLNVLNKETKKLEKNLIIEIAKNNLIKDKIKRIELLRNIESISINEEYLNNLIVNNYKKLGFNDFEEYIKFLNYSGVKIEKIKEKITLDANWSQFIYQKYKNKIKIDKEKIIKNISQEKVKSFNLSEILFNLNENETIDSKYKIIESSIKQKGFKNSASIFSKSDTSLNGGSIGWIKSSAISKNIVKELNLLKVNNYTKPIKVPSGFLILK